MEDDMLRQESLHDQSPLEKKGGRVLVCAWCRALLEPGPRTGDELENFGICRRCLSEQLSLASRTGGTLE
jgi:hypothetical protein